MRSFRSFISPLVLGLAASTAACSTDPPIRKAVNASSYNVQFLTPSWYSDTRPIESGHWPNSSERALEIANEAFVDCPSVILLQESVNDLHRQEIHARLNARCGRGYAITTLQHDWDPVLDTVTDGPAYMMAVIESALEGVDKAALDAAGADTPDEVLQIIVDGQAGALGLPPLDTVRKPTPIIDEEVAILSTMPIVGFAQMEFSRASGFDKFAAKGALFNRLHVTNRTDPPPARTSPLPPPPRDPLCGVTRSCEDPVMPPDEGTMNPDAAGAALDVFVTHFNADPRPHAVQISELLAFARSHHDPEAALLVGGDFNIALNATGPDGMTAAPPARTAAFLSVCRGLVAATPDLLPGDECDPAAGTTQLDLQHADVGATNQQGWDTDRRAVSMTRGSQIDHAFVHSTAAEARFTRRYNPLRPFDPPVGLVADGKQTLSDHAELEVDTQIRLRRYVERAPYTVDRNIRLTVHAVHAAIDDGCGAPDPQGVVTLGIGGQSRQIAFGPADDQATLQVDKSVSVSAAAGTYLGTLQIDLSEYDHGFCGGDDELDIDPDPARTNATITLDLTWDGGIQLNESGLGWFGQPVKLQADGNWISFTVFVEPS